ncbi:MAG TPA: 3-dehydroquinate synthase family protein [Thermoanaerobaculia bacterium]|nr:3-dehydroquinate synthase family protein [Thermoanaerobaculia bacterium]
MTAATPERIPVSGPPAESTAWVGPGLLADAARYLASPSGRFLLAAAPSAGASAAVLRHALGARCFAEVAVDDAEASKSLASVERIADAAFAAGLRRDDAVVAVGGGVVTDLVGFTAAILLRGVTWNAVPTTTAGMADAAIGGKTGVNHRLGKNLLGAFHPPAVILVDPRALATLPDRDYRAGLVEAYKDAWIGDGALAARAGAALAEILARREAPLLDLLAGSVRVKAAVVSADPKEGDRRRLLNFGHTLGHAVEAAAGWGGLRHGEAVAWGIAAALEISRRRAGLPDPDARAVRQVLAGLGPFPEPERDAGKLRGFLARDKKATARGLASVLLSRLGAAVVDENVPPEEWLDAAAIMSLS